MIGDFKSVYLNNVVLAQGHACFTWAVCYVQHH